MDLLQAIENVVVLNMNRRQRKSFKFIVLHNLLLFIDFPFIYFNINILHFGFI